MEVKQQREVEQTVDILCDVCGRSTVTPTGIEAGRLEASWGQGSAHDGQQYRVDLCESCFFSVLGTLSREHQTNTLFDEGGPREREGFGLLNGERVARAWGENPDLPRDFVESTLRSLDEPPETRSPYRFGSAASDVELGALQAEARRAAGRADAALFAQQIMASHMHTQDPSGAAALANMLRAVPTWNQEASAYLERLIRRLEGEEGLPLRGLDEEEP